MKLSDINNKRLYNQLVAIRPAIATAAQAIYDEWDQSEDDFGICDQIADAIGTILNEAGIDNTYGGHDGDDHAYIIAYNESESYVIDIPYNTYEIGSGYSWKKIPDVTFDQNDVVIDRVERPDWIDDN